MDDQIADDQIAQFTLSLRKNIVVAECCAGVGCTTAWANGVQLDTWEYGAIPEALPVDYSQGGLVTTKSEFAYWLVKWDGLRSFEPFRGPLTANELRELIGRPESLASIRK
jgi:hypothetical protein